MVVGYAAEGRRFKRLFPDRGAAGFAGLGFAAVNLTISHKQTGRAIVDEVHESARQIGARSRAANRACPPTPAPS